MKKLLFLFVALSVAVFTSCSKDDNDEIKPDVKPNVIGIWKLHQETFPDGEVVNDPGIIYLELLEGNKFREVALEQKGGGELEPLNYKEGYYALQGNKLVTTRDIMWNWFDVCEVKSIDNDTIEITFDDNGEVFKFILKRTTFDFEPYMPS